MSETALNGIITKLKADEPPECAEHLVVKDTFHLVTGRPRVMPGDCYCVRCSKPVPYVLRDGKGWPVEREAAFFADAPNPPDAPPRRPVEASNA